MANFKINYFFQGPLQTGWTETLYTVAADHTTALGRAFQLVDTRGALLGKDNQIVDVRVSDDQIIGDSMTTGPVSFQPIIKTENADVSWTAAQTRIVAGTLYRRTLMIRGIPDYLFSSDGANLQNQLDWQKAHKKFCNKMIDQQIAIKAKARGVDQASFRISKVEVLAGTGYKVSTFEPHGLAQGDQVFIYNMREAPQLAGLRTVQLTTGPTSIEIDVLPNPDFKYLQKSYLRKVRYIYPTVSQAEFIRIAKRSTGRPFALFRGRAR